MSERSTEQIRELLDSLYRVDSGRILATPIRLLGDFDLAEEVKHEAFAAALTIWPRSDLPDNPRPWLISTARFKAIGTLRRRTRFERLKTSSRDISKRNGARQKNLKKRTYLRMIGCTSFLYAVIHLSRRKRTLRSPCVRCAG
ncbi:sigma factor [Granulicella sp. L60]|uniref:sigma factor n=1 Tax=Granulicella sp. L60 TaxID=1641866 RepID=UPI0020B13105|nr:sigma factor [Granulicella sp. L60]